MDVNKSTHKTKSLVPPVILLVAILAADLHLFQKLFGINPGQEISLAILIVAATLWVTEFVPLFVTSFVILLLQLVWLLPILTDAGVEVFSHDFLSPFFSDVILLFMGGFILSILLHKYAIDHRIAHKILIRTGGRPSSLLIAVLVVCATLSMWMSNTAAAAMMFAIILPIIKQIPSDNNYSKALALSIPFACNLGGIGTPIGSPPNVIALGYLSKVGIEISFASWMQISVPFMIVMLVILWQLLAHLFPTGDFRFDLEQTTNKKMSRKEILIVVIFIGTCVGWLTTKYHGLSPGTVSLILIVLCYGTKILGTADFRSQSWDVLFMIGGGMTLGVGLRTSGLTQVIVDAVPIGTDFGIIIIAFVSLAAVMTTFMSNTATANLIIPLAISLSSGVGLVVVSVAVMCSSAMALPVSTPPNAIAFGSGLLKSRDMIFLGGLITLCAILLALFVGRPYWELLGL